MKINLSSVRMDEQLTLDREGDHIYVNGELFDFSPLLNGATIPREAISSEWFFDDVHRVDGELILTIRLPHGANAPETTRYPETLNITEDGPVDLPVYDIVHELELDIPPAEPDEEEPIIEEEVWQETLVGEDDEY